MPHDPFGLLEQLSSANRVINLGCPKRRSSQFKGAYRESSVTAEVAEFLRSERVFRRRCEIRAAVIGCNGLDARMTEEIQIEIDAMGAA